MPDIEYLKEKILAENYPLDSPLYKLFSKPLVATTAEYAIPDLTLNYQNSVVIQTWESLFLTLLALTSFFCALAINVNTNNPKIPFIIAWPVVLVILYLVYKYVKAFHNEVILDKYGITIKKQRFEWKDIIQTFILDEANQSSGRNQPKAIFLVIVDNNEIISKFEITYLGTSPKMFATIIEYFKNKTAGNVKQ